MANDVIQNPIPGLKDYEVISKIGEGGLAEIFKARQISLNRPVAIKILFSELSKDPDIVRRFDQESTTIARLNHPNIVHVIDKGKTDERYFFIMEYVDGTSFKDIIHSRKINLRKKLEIVVNALKGLDYAHKNGVIHRDIKPANILVDRQGNTLVADFGIAHIASKTKDIDVTSSEIVMGTMAYMSPEQKVSAANVDLTTDLYAIGIVLYEILTGKRPAGNFKKPTEINPSLSTKFDQIVLKCLEQDPQDRYQSAVELKNAILEAVRPSSPVTDAALTQQSSDARINSFMGKCQFLDTLKETRYSNTMLVENTETHELYVIKKNNRGNEGLKEARLLTNLRHNNIIEVYGAGGDDRRLVIMMQYATSGSLADRMVRPYPFDEAIDIIIKVANALEFSQKNGIIHGNLRPSNILFTKDGTVKVTDFGLPPHYNLMEKNWYAPPEKRVSAQGDVYSLGVIFYKLLFEKNPAFDRSYNLVIDKGIQEISLGVDKILKKMLAIRVAQRYRTVEEFLNDWDDVQKAIAARKKIRKPGIVAPSPKKTDHKKIIFTAVVVIIAIFVILYLSGIFK